MNRRKYGTIALGVTCFVLLSALLVSLAVNLAAAIFVALLLALEASWFYYTPTLWIQKHTIAFPALGVYAKSGMRCFGRGLFMAVTLITSATITISGAGLWHGIVNNWQPERKIIVMLSLTLAFICASSIYAIVSDYKPRNAEYMHLKQFCLIVAISLGAGIMWPLILAVVILTLMVAVTWICAAALIGIAMLATEVHMLVLTISIIVGSLASLIPGVDDVTPLNLIIRITIGAIAGFTCGEGLHRFGQFLAYTRSGQEIVKGILLRS